MSDDFRNRRERLLVELEETLSIGRELSDELKRQEGKPYSPHILVVQERLRRNESHARMLAARFVDMGALTDEEVAALPEPLEI